MTYCVFFTFLEVVIEEIPDDDQTENGDGQSKQLKKKEKGNKSSQLAIRGGNNLALESEDEDGFPISTGKSESHKAEAETKGEQEHKKTGKENKKQKDVDHPASLKRKVESADEDKLLQDG